MSEETKGTESQKEEVKESQTPETKKELSDDEKQEMKLKEEGLEKYIKDLRDENRKYRKQIEGIEEENKKAKESKMKEEGQLKELLDQKEQELEKLKKNNRSIIINSELKVKAQSLGMKDLDGLRMIPQDRIEAIEIDEDGKVKGIDEILNDLKKNKEYLFSEPKKAVKVETGNPGSGSQTAQETKSGMKVYTNF